MSEYQHKKLGKLNSATGSENQLDGAFGQANEEYFQNSTEFLTDKN